MMILSVAKLFADKMLLGENWNRNISEVHVVSVPYLGVRYILSDGNVSFGINQEERLCVND